VISFSANEQKPKRHTGMINVGTGNIFLAKSRIEATSTNALELENSVSLDSRVAKRAPTW
jgi:hypothetical protein